jgi:hypothetical protein
MLIEEEALWDYLHEKVGYCSHCGKRSCMLRRERTTLPDKLDTELVIKAVDAARKATTRATGHTK